MGGIGRVQEVGVGGWRVHRRVRVSATEALQVGRDDSNTSDITHVPPKPAAMVVFVYQLAVSQNEVSLLPASQGFIMFRIDS